MSKKTEDGPLSGFLLSLHVYHYHRFFLRCTIIIYVFSYVEKCTLKYMKVHFDLGWQQPARKALGKRNGNANKQTPNLSDTT
jgi:hypothetical protein